MTRLPELSCIAKGETTVKGFREPVMVYEVDDTLPARVQAASA
jgi:class 3 adenylate cyclase